MNAMQVVNQPKPWCPEDYLIREIHRFGLIKPPYGMFSETLNVGISMTLSLTD